jgi:hypothetical protein
MNRQFGARKANGNIKERKKKSKDNIVKVEIVEENCI